MTIQMLGTGCPTYTVLQKNLEQPIKELGQGAIWQPDYRASSQRYSSRFL